MTDVIELTEFYESFCSLYGIDNDEFGIEEDENGEYYSTAFPDGEIDEDVFEYMLLITGLTREEFLGMKKETLEKYLKKFPFFRLNREFNQTYSLESQFLDFEYVPYIGRVGKIDRYDVKDLKKRIIRKTMDINHFIEGTYHPNATPVGLVYSTEWAISFPKYKQLITSLFRMIVRYKELFFRAIDGALEEEEICELNFLASSLDVRDLIQDDIGLQYDHVLALRDVYRTENLKDFFSYVKIGRLERTKYWRCVEFLKYKKLAWTYISMYPEAFSEMRKYLMRMDKFSCWFNWSDNVPEEWKEEAAKSFKPRVNEEATGSWFENYLMSLDDDEYDEYIHKVALTGGFEDDFLDDDPYDPEEPYDMGSPNWLIQEEELDKKVENKDFLGIKYIEPDDEEWLEPLNDKRIHLYIEKTEDETHSWHCEQIREIIQPAEKGGFPLPKRECVSDKLVLKDGRTFDRKSARLQALTGGV